MDDQNNDQLDMHVQQLRAWIYRNKLNGIAETVFDVLAPLGTVAAQLLYVGQPTMRLFLPNSNLDQWARLLDTPDGVEWLRVQLIETDECDGK